MSSMGCRYFWIVLGYFLIMTDLLASPPKGINWFKGSVEEAFQAAKTSNRPLFLYWGAVWCPPCTKMKKTVFSKPTFQKKIKAFIPVYFDGDQERAQIWGEKLKSKGYPTLMIFNASGKEMMRLPIDVSVERYIKLLDMALKKNVKSIAQILKSLSQKPAQKIPREDWSMLAGHAWFQDGVLGLSEKDMEKTLKKLYKKIPTSYKSERYRLFLLYLSRVRGEVGNVREYVATLDEILADPHFIDKNFASVILVLPSVIQKVYGGKSVEDRQRVERHLLALAAGRGQNPEEKLLSLYPTLVFKKGSLSLSFKKKMLGVVDEIDKSVKDPQERQNIMSTAIKFLMNAELIDKARAYALKELHKSSAPFYFMSILSNIEQKKGNVRATLEWSRKAWKASEGANTRLSWGTLYLLKILSLNSQDAPSVVSTFKKVFEEIRGREDAFSGRNQERFSRLGEAMAKWEDKKGRKELWEYIQKSCPKTCLEKMRGWGFAFP